MDHHRGYSVLLPPPLECFKPERRQWLQWAPGTVGSMTIADVSPRFAVKRILVLYENAQYREAANFVNRLSHGTFKTVLSQLPVDLFIEAMPHSLSVLEALYAKVFLSSDCGIKMLRPESVTAGLVKVFALAESERWVPSARKLLKVIVLSEPKLKKALLLRRRALDKAVEGLGQHGLVGTSDGSMSDLRDALKVEFRRLADTYKTALQKLEELAVKKGGAPVQASHQRQLSLRQTDVQERLIKNKTLLNLVEPASSDSSLPILLTILRRRVECDKDALFQFTQLKKELKIEAEQVVAPLLVRYTHACDKVLDLMREAGDDGDDSSDISGYHSDSDSAIMMSGNSPYVTKRARHNFLNRSVRSTRSGRTCRGLSSSSSASPQDRGSTTEWEWSEVKSNSNSIVSNGLKKTHLKPWCTSCQDRAVIQLGVGEEVGALQGELERTRHELDQTKARLEILDKHQQAKELGAARLVRCYGNLYSRGRAETLTALDNLTQLNQSHELKSKILFSVIVLSFRAAGSEAGRKREQVRRILLSPAPQSPAHTELEEAVSTYLRRTLDTFDLTHPVQVLSSEDEILDLESCLAINIIVRRTGIIQPEVSSQLWATLYDYPCLKDCPGLQQYITEAVRLAWALVNQGKEYKLEYEERVFRTDLHVRFHSADPERSSIRTYLWPALLSNGNCLYKAVVLT